jgi:selenocysteine-specific elongation factor
VLLVVAADEGVMPQTREHLAILSLLGIERGLVVLTKADLVQDPDWLKLVEADVRALLADSRLADATALAVSAKTGAGLDRLRQELASVLRETPPRMDHGRPRLPVDRVFSMAGFGTVVTGTLVDGSLTAGQEVEFAPSGLRGRIRGLQSHRSRLELARPGSRVAVNVSGVEVQAVHRGEVLGLPGTLPGSRLLDIRLRCLPEASTPITHNLEVKVFLGTAQRVGRLRLLDADRILPGEECWAQLVLRLPAVAGRGERLVVRRPSPGETLGGGIIADPLPGRLHRRRDAEMVARLERMLGGEPDDALLEAARVSGPATLRTLAESTELDTDRVVGLARQLMDAGRLKQLHGEAHGLTLDSLLMAEEAWQAISRRAASFLGDYHAHYALRPGMPREELKSRLGLEARVFGACLDAWVGDGLLKESAGAIALAAHTTTPSATDQARIDRVLSRLDAARFSPPTVKELVEELGEEAYAFLVATRAVVPVSADVAFSPSAYDELTQRVQSLLAREGEATVARIRDEFETSRKYVLALLEHTDALGLTVRSGDVRRLGPRATGA